MARPIRKRIQCPSQNENKKKRTHLLTGGGDVKRVYYRSLVLNEADKHVDGDVERAGVLSNPLRPHLKRGPSSLREIQRRPSRTFAEDLGALHLRCRKTRFLNVRLTIGAAKTHDAQSALVVLTITTTKKCITSLALPQTPIQVSSFAGR